jgi:hypothetical protein
MDVIDYCLSLEQDLNGWKEKLDGLRRMIEGLDGREREAMLSSVQDLAAFVERMSARLGELKAECPTRAADDQAPRPDESDPTVRTAP